MARFTDLQQEILGYICTFLERGDLAALALSARVLRYEAERQLYREMVLCCGRAELQRSLGSLFINGRRRYHHVRSLSVMLDGQPGQVLADAINSIKNATFLSLWTNSAVPCQNVRTFPRALRSLHIGFNVFEREIFFELLRTVPLLENLAVFQWPVEKDEEELPAGVLPALRSVWGSVFMVLAILPARHTVTTVSIQGDYVWTPVMDALTGKNILDLEVMFENSTVDGICAACPHVETIKFTDVFTEDLETWIDGRFPDGFLGLKNMRTLLLQIQLIQGPDYVAPGSATALYTVLQRIWPKLESVKFFRHAPFSGDEYMQSS